MKVCQGTESQKKDAAVEILKGKWLAVDIRLRMFKAGIFLNLKEVWLVHRTGTICGISQCILVIMFCTKDRVMEEDFEL